MTGSKVVTSVSHSRSACSPTSGGDAGPVRVGQQPALQRGFEVGRLGRQRIGVVAGRLGGRIRGVLGEAQMHQRRPGVVAPAQPVPVGQRRRRGHRDPERRRQ